MYNVIKALNTRRSPNVDLTKIAVVYDTTIAGEQALCEAYMTARSIPSTHLYGIALGTTYSGATMATVRTAFLTALGDYFVTNSIEMVATGPNSPILIADGGWDNLGISFSSLCGQALKHSTLFTGSPVTTWNASNTYGEKTYYPENGGINVREEALAYRSALEKYQYVKDEDDLIEIDGIDIEAFQLGGGAFPNGQIAIDQGRTQDINGNLCATLPNFRIGFHSIANSNVSITAQQITDMVTNSMALANTRAYHKANTNVTVVSNGRTTKITNFSGTYAHYLVDQMGYTNNTFGFRSDTSGNDFLSTIGTQTGIAKYNGTSAAADFSIDRDSPVGGASTTTFRTPNYNAYEYTAHNGNTFPITSGLIVDTACENPQSGAHINPDIWTSGDADQIFELETGAIIQTTTSHGLKAAPSQIANGAGCLIGSYREPGDTGVGNGCDTIQYLLKGYDCATAKLLDFSKQNSPSEVWGDGLTQFVNDVPVLSNEETAPSLTVAFTSRLNAAYAITGAYQNTVGEGTMVINAFDESNFDSYDYKISAFADVADATMAFITSETTTGGFTVIFESATSAGNITTNVTNQPLPFDYVRVTDILDASRLDRVITKEEFGNSYALSYATGGVYTLTGEFLLEADRDYTIQFSGGNTDRFEVLSFSALPGSTDLAGSFVVDSVLTLGANGCEGYREFEASSTATFYPQNLPADKPNNVEVVIPDINLRNLIVKIGSASYSAKQQELTVDETEATLAETESDLADAIASGGSAVDIANLTATIPNLGLIRNSVTSGYLNKAYTDGEFHTNDDLGSVNITSAVVTNGVCTIVSGTAISTVTGKLGTLTLEDAANNKALVVYNVTLA